MDGMIMENEWARGRLLSRTDGERRLTNLLHCFEVIHAKSHEQGIGMERLASWFISKVAAREEGEEYEIRLETDEQALRIVTVHVSKGLEYPIVFCPYMWHGIREITDIATFHAGHTMVRDIGSPDFTSHRQKAETEAIAESLRLLYVAVTRAQYCCYLYAGKVTGSSMARSRPDLSPLAYLFHATPETRNADNIADCLSADYHALDHDQMRSRMQELVNESGGVIGLEQLEEAPVPSPWNPVLSPQQSPVCRLFRGHIRRDWRVASFTSFATREVTAIELPDRDGTVAPKPAPQDREYRTGLDIFSFPRGAEAGIFMHGLFENLDFARADTEKIRDLTANTLALHGFGEEWLPCVTDMIREVISAPLRNNDNATFTLSDLKPGSWRTEMEFFFPLRFVTSEQLRLTLEPFLELQTGTDFGKILASLDFRPVRGMLRGFMDMFFEHKGCYYLLDWKSNHLGNSREQYHPVALNREMEQNLYQLQYLLYTVALNRYLSLRAPGYEYERNFGGVFYLFVRGISSSGNNDSGIYRDRPSPDLIDALTRLLVENEDIHDL